MKVYFKQSLVALLVFNISFSSFATGSGVQNPQAVPAQETTPEATVALGRLEKSLSALEAAAEGTLPGKTKDTFLLTKQFIRHSSENEKLHSLSEIGDLPLSVTVSEFEKEVTVSLHPESNSFALNFHKQGKITAQHIIYGISPISMARDKEILTLLDKNGKLYALDMGYAKSQAFKGPIPVVHLVDTKIPEKFGNKINSAYVKRDLTPIKIDSNDSDIILPLDKALTAGDLILWTDEGTERKLVGLFDRNVIRTQLYTAEALIALMAYQADPAPEKDFAVEESFGIAKNAADERIPAEVLASLEKLSPNAVTKLLSRAKRNQTANGEQRDQFTLQEWADQFQRLYDASQKEVPPTVQIPLWKKGLKTPANLFHKVMNPQAMKTVAKIVAGGVAIYAADRFENGGQGVIWATHMIHQLYDLYYPDVLKDASYRITLLKSTLALSGSAGLIYGAGWLYAKTKKLPWTAQKTLAVFGMRVFGSMIIPFYHHLAKISRQPNLMRSMQLGINPFAKVSADSTIGKAVNLQRDAIPAFNNPFARKENFQNETQSKNKLQSLMYQSKSRTRALAKVFALQVVSAKYGIDPATLAALSEKGTLSMSKEQIESLINKPEFLSDWKQISGELFIQFSKLNQGQANTDLAKLDINELNEYYKLASETAEDFINRKGLRKLAMKFKIAWSNLAETTLIGVSSFGAKEADFLKNAEPSDFVVSQFWKQFVSDYLLTVFQVGLVGDRANLSDPQALAANEHSFMWTTPGHRFDMIDQIRIYMINVPARMSLVYQEAAETKESSYSPIERSSLDGKETTEAFGKSVLQWSLGAGNIVKVNYGVYFMRGLQRTVKSIQANLIMSMIGRMAFAGQSFVAAAPAFAYGILWGQWQFGWLWEPINRGNQLYEERLDEIKEKITAAKFKIGKGLRMDDAKQIAEGYKELAALYEKTSGVPTEIKQMINEGMTFISSVTPEHLEQLKSESAIAIEGLRKLQEAVQTGNSQLLTEARQEILNLYANSGSQTEGEKILMMKLDASALLAYALEKPPIATKGNPYIQWITTGTGSLVTTYWATTMSVLTFRADVPWSQVLLTAGLYSAGLYTGFYYGQKGLNWLFQDFKIVDKVKAKVGQFRNPIENLDKDASRNNRAAVSAIRCEGVLLKH